MADTKELVEQVRALALLIGPLAVNGRDAVLLKEAADALERLERERDEALAKGGATARLALSLEVEADERIAVAEAELATLRARLAKMEEALKPFADVAACYPKADKEYPHPVSTMGVYDKSCPVYIRDYFNAYAALTGEQQP